MYFFKWTFATWFNDLPYDLPMSYVMIVSPWIAPERNPGGEILHGPTATSFQLSVRLLDQPEGQTIYDRSPQKLQPEMSANTSRGNKEETVNSHAMTI